MTGILVFVAGVLGFVVVLLLVSVLVGMVRHVVVRGRCGMCGLELLDPVDVFCGCDLEDYWRGVDVTP